ncbi:MAG TPA: reverse transcriptase domain-containing protein [Thermomicrobiales bacterium]|jgi:group II intron reverse transcriptase/maturase|nr:reverse transcriptase domain-containing protein [Thermomicrobiales bacterium]
MEGGSDTPGAGGLLERMLALDNLRWAWLRVAANKGAAGADGVTVRQFERLRDANLLALADAVRDGTYRPGAPRRVDIRAKTKTRRIAILPVADRVLQRAALEVLTPIAEPIFLPCSFGYRPGRSVQDAVERIVELRDRGLTWVVDADIEDCFGSLDHDLLRQFFEPLAPDMGLRRLLALWATIPHGRLAPPKSGIPLGAVISPLLCNVYLHHLDRSLRRRRLQIVRYADDFVILCKSEAHADRALRTTEKVLGGLRLRLNRAKTRLTNFDDGFDFLGVRFEGTDYSYETEGKRITIDQAPPAFFHYHPEGYE